MLIVLPDGPPATALLFFTLWEPRNAEADRAGTVLFLLEGARLEQQDTDQQDSMAQAFVFGADLALPLPPGRRKRLDAVHCHPLAPSRAGTRSLGG